MGMDAQINVKCKQVLHALIGLEVFQDVEETAENDIRIQYLCLLFDLYLLLLLFLFNT
jgi:hypothetical protein